ncbi:Helicase associated domain protein [Kitasatospora sp. LaBMicrA B282]|uniref:helicase associated domain-containing protein n=1 Tax=Kitasatospora sp. LaBMicrA B282 TaxID=3420949 RepID=UPI003D0FB670
MDTATAPAAVPTAAAAPVPDQPPATVPLHWFQKEAVAAAVKALCDGGRATIVAATGSGKTLIAARCAWRLAAKSAVLVLVPTIELLEQTAAAWSLKGGRRGLSIAACSNEEALEQAEAGGRLDAHVTTDAAEIADLVASARPGEPVTLYATYASLERIVQAHQLCGMPAFDLVIIDEAHRTAGASAKAWAAIHTDAQVPARRRLYMTATPRIADDTKASDSLDTLLDGALPELCSMDDERIFGKIVYEWTLGQGIEHEFLADYRVLAPVITDEDLRELLNLPAIADLKSQCTNEDLLRLALQVAVLRAIEDLDLRRVLTFHSRVPAARRFAETLPEAASLLPDAERPEHVWARAVAGTDRLKDRRARFAEFKKTTSTSGLLYAILSNSRLLAEGIDLPAVDAVVFADPKSSVIDIVQAIGRALRQAYQQGKVAWIIIPVYLPTPEIGDDVSAADPAEVKDAGPGVRAEADGAIDASAFRTIWRVLRALAAHDARLVGRITELRTNRSQPKAHAEGAGGTEGQGQAVEAFGEEAPVEWLQVSATANAAAILRTLKLRAFSPRTAEWQRLFELAAAFYSEHGHLDPREGELVSWLDQQRYLHHAGLLHPARKNELDRIGMIWSKHAHSWDRGFAYAAAHHHRHGDLAIPVSAVIEDYRAGEWMRRQRKNPDLTAEQQARLDRLDPLWRLDPDWNRSYRRYQTYLAAGGTLTGPVNRPGLGEDPTFAPGKWQRRQLAQASAGKHTEEQTRLLTEIGLPPAA